MKTIDLIAELIRIGRDGTFDRLPALIGLSPEHRSGKFMRQLPEFWTDISANLTAHEIIALIKALTVTERDVAEMKAGSVSPVIWLYRYLRQRFPGQYTELEDWVLRQTDNDYLPWGTSNHGARSLDEFRRFSEQVVKRRQDRQRSEEQRQVETIKRKAEKATHDLLGAIRRKDGEAIIALRRKGADVNAISDLGKSVLDLARETGDPKVIEAVTSTLKEEE